MSAVNQNMLAYLSMANASRLPELTQSDQEVIEGLFQNALRGNTAEAYVGNLENAPRRNPELQSAAMALRDQFIKDNNMADLNLSEYELMDEYGATKCYQVTEENSQVVFDVTFYFYGGIISGWSVKPEKASYEKYKRADPGPEIITRGLCFLEIGKPIAAMINGRLSNCPMFKRIPASNPTWSFFKNSMRIWC